MKRHLLPLVLAFASMPAVAQTMAPVGVDFFGDGIVKPVPMDERGRIRISSIDLPDKPAPIAGYEHVMLFHDGRQMRGTLVELSADEVLWKRSDADVEIRFPRRTVRRIEFKQSGNVDRTEKSPREGLVLATVKLPGSDWLHGDLRSENGTDFSLTLANGSAVPLAKSQMEWVYFSANPVPAFGFSGQALDLEGWILGNNSEGIEVTGNSFRIPGNSWIGRNMSAPDRFQVDFMLPTATSGNNPVRLWIQPMTPSPNSYGTGTIELAFGAKELGYLIYGNVFERKSVAYPKESDNGGEASHFLVSYDTPKNRLIVQRNGVMVGEWKLIEENQHGMQVNGERMRPRGLCFNREYGNEKTAMGPVRVHPWNGVVETGKQKGPQVEQITIGREAPKPGTLEAVTEKELIVSGEKLPRKHDTFIEFGTRAEGLAGGDSLLIFGDKGELATAELRIREARATCRTSIIPKLDVSTDTLESIVFPTAKVEVAAATDVLIFRNGDSLRGTLLAASSGSSIRWKTSEGQEICFQPEHVAGARLRRAEPPQLAEGSIVELTNGDRITGQLIALDRETLRLRHTQLGERAIARGQLQTLFCDPKAFLLDAGADPELWLGLRPQKIQGGVTVLRTPPSNKPVERQERVFLDGHFIGPAYRNGTYRYQGVSYALEDLPDRYELRCVITDSGGADPTLYLTLGGKSGASLQLNLGYGRFRIYGYNLGKARAGGFQDNREIPFSSKLASLTTRREVRMFVDTKLGTVDYLVDGVHFYKLGKQVSERAPGIGGRISLSSYSRSAVSVFSNISLRPWNGEVPTPGEVKNSIYLANGDVAAGAIGDLKDGKLRVNVGSDLMEIPISRITSAEFAQTPVPAKFAARLRLTDGAIVNVDQFEWKDGSLTAKSAALGDLQMSGQTVAEVIFSPASVYSPIRPEAKKLANKEPKKAEEPAE